MPSLRRTLATLAALAAVTTSATVSSPAPALGAGAGTAPPAAGATSGTARPALGRDAVLQRRLERLVRTTGLPGAVATVRGRDGRVRTYRAGVGDLRTGRPIPRDPRVRIASNTKMFTAVVVLQLVAEGRVRLDAPVERYLPGLLRGPGGDGRRTTVRQLLQQTSGLPDYDTLLVGEGQSLRSLAETYIEPRDLVDAALAGRRAFRPGQRWEYSNTNYVVLGLLAQRVTGRHMGALVRDRIARPLGLSDTYWPAAGERRIRGAHPRAYLADGPDGAWQEITRMDPSFGWAAGQLVASPRDLGRFMQGLLGGRLLPADLLREMRSTVRAPGFDADPGWRYGLGLASHRLGCGVTGWGHGGDIQGFETRNLATDDGRWAVVAVTGLPSSLEQVRTVSRMVETAVCRS
ncbi:serine hydrolase domain-containing protein [Nocardioides litoris]|uniref:serine hydrolase domain-containing protein n=1 Tax=Nocardioides litoris TaxID=1926648 RepID=UPI001FE6CC83|nr:serine hydrolase domain-containing protein [Nocardioides litoris]